MFVGLWQLQELLCGFGCGYESPVVDAVLVVALGAVTTCVVCASLCVYGVGTTLCPA